MGTTHCKETGPANQKKKDVLSSKGRALPCLLQPVPKCPTPSPKCSQPQSLPLQSFCSSLQPHAVLCPRPSPAEPFPTLPSGMPFLSLVLNSSILLKPTQSPLSLPLPGPMHQASRASRCCRHGWQPRRRATCALLASSVTPRQLSFATYSSGMPESTKSDSKALTESLQEQKQTRRHRV